MLFAAALSLVAAVADAADAPNPTITTPAVYPTVTINPRQASTQIVPSTYETVTPLPLTEYWYPYDKQPHQVMPYPVVRGPQAGYNDCNSTTEGADSLCQTAVFNSIDDFCFWGAQGTGEVIGDIEAAVVSYCSRAGHGGRIFPQGTFSSIQFMRTPAYIQIVGVFNQLAIGLTANDTGGELDPHGADNLGNPLGGLFYSKGFSSGDNKTYIQTQSWTHFLGSNVFCLKLCDPNYAADTNNYCENVYDLIGCEYNMPADYAALKANSVFMSCDGELQDVVGTYTQGGQTLTWKQTDPVVTVPYSPRIPASSNCVTYQSTDLFPASMLGYQSTSTMSTTASASAGASGAQSGASVGMDGKATPTTGAAAQAGSTGAKSSATPLALPSIGACTVLALVVSAILA